VELVNPERPLSSTEKGLIALVCLGVLLPFLLFIADALFLWDFSALSLPFVKLLSRSLLFGMSEAAVSAALSLLLAATIALSLLSCRPSRRKIPAQVLQNLGNTLFILPGTAIALLLFALPTSLLESAEGWLLIVSAHVVWSSFFVASHLFERLSDWLESEGADLLRVTRSLGASPHASLKAVVYPLLWEEFRSWFPLIFLWSLGAFSTVLLLGSGPQHSTPEVLLYYTLSNDLDSTRLLILFAVSLCLQLLLLSLFTRTPVRSAPARFVLNSDSALVSKRRQRVELPSRGTLLTISTGSMLLVGVLIVIQATSIFRSGLPDPELWSGLSNSVSYALLTSLFCFVLLLALAASRSTLRKSALFLLALSPVLIATSWTSIGLGGVSALGKLPSLLLCALALALLQLPFAALWIERSLSALSSETLLYARSAGLSRRQIFWKIEVPYLRPVFEKLLTYAFCIALGEIALASIWMKEMPLLSLASKKLAQSYDFHSASWVFVLTLVAALLARSAFKKILEKLFP